MFDLIAGFAGKFVNYGRELFGSLLLALVLNVIFSSAGAGGAAGLLSLCGAGAVAYAVHQRKKRKKAAGLQRGTDIKE
ncbi:MAG: hypothetical protein ACYCXX_11305 [Acidiferrobacter thiooxydans]|jgi:ABC-type Fe3+ transport system permease subunit